MRFIDEDESFRREVREYLEDTLSGEFDDVRGVGGPGDEHRGFEARLAWERRLGADGWTCIAWPKEHGGREASVIQQAIWHEEYAAARAPAAGNGKHGRSDLLHNVDHGLRVGVQKIGVRGVRAGVVVRGRLLRAGFSGRIIGAGMDPTKQGVGVGALHDSGLPVVRAT